MEDENGLELSLGLSCGGSSIKPKGKNGSSTDLRAEESSDRGSKIVDDFKNFLHGGTQIQDPGTGPLKSNNNNSKPRDNFFSDLSNNNKKSIEAEEEKHLDMSNKRKLLLHERESSHHNNLHEKTRSPFISLTEEGSTAENEDVAESEVEGSTSRLFSSSQNEDSSKRYKAIEQNSSDLPKEIVRGVTDSGGLDLNGHKRFNGSSDNEFKLGNLSYAVPFSSQTTVNMMNNVQPNSVGGPGGPIGSYSLPGIMQVLNNTSSANGSEQAGPHNLKSPGNLSLTFGYPPVQLPTMDKDNSWGLVSHSSQQQFHNLYSGRGPPNSEFEGRTLEPTNVDNKQLGIEEGPSTQLKEDVKGSNLNLGRPKDPPSERSTAEGSSSSPLDFSAIKPGIAAEIKFGGSGSYPNLPWVSTTGPKGRTISGVTYRFNANQIRIVCACHGTHMSPEEFVRHAGEENANPESDNGSATFPNNNPAASAQS